MDVRNGILSCELLIFTDQFPLLQLDKNQKNIMARLEKESREINRKFAVLVSETDKVLTLINTTVQKLTLVIKNFRPSINKSSSSKLIKKLKKRKNNDITGALDDMSDFWSFFDYEILSTIIESCKDDRPDLKAKLDDYIREFTIFCKRRLCDVNVDAFKERKVHPNVNIKLDAVFTIPVKDVKEIIAKLSTILHTSFCLVGVQKGCVELAYVCMHELHEIFPLSDKQKQELSQIQVLKIYNDKEVYYERMKPEVLSDEEVFDERVKPVPESRQISTGELFHFSHSHIYFPSSCDFKATVQSWL